MVGISADGRAHRTVGMFAVCLGALLQPLDFAVNVAFSDIVTSLGRTDAAVPWIVTSYILVFLSLMLVSGRIADVYGHRRAFIYGLVLSAVAFLLCGLAEQFGWHFFLASRGLQGIGMALVISCCPGLAKSYYPRGRHDLAVGIYTSMFGLGFLIAPLIAGFVIEFMGWPSIFFLRIPVALLAIAIMCILPRAASPDSTSQDEPGKVDLLGAILVSVFLALAVLALRETSSAHEDDWYGVAIMAAGAVLGFVWFVRHELRAAAPIVDLRDFFDLRFATLNGVSCAVNLMAFAVVLLVPVYLSALGSYSTSDIGTYLAAVGFGFFVGSWTPQFLKKIFPRIWMEQNRLALAGAFLVALGLWLVPNLDGFPNWHAWLPLFFLIGLGHGLFTFEYNVYVLAYMKAHHQGVAGSLIVLTRTAGVVVGATVLMMIYLAAGFQSAFEYAAVGLAVFLLLSTILSPGAWFGGDR